MPDTTTDEPMATLARRGSAALIGLVANAAFTFAFTLIATHQLQPKDTGALFEAIAIFTITGSIAILGADVGLLRFAPTFSLSRPHDIRRLLIVALIPSLLVSLVAGGVLYQFSTPLAHAFLKGSEARGTGRTLRVFAAFLPIFSCTTVILAATRAWSIRSYVGIGNMLLPLLRVVLLGVASIAGATLFRSALAWTTPLLLTLLLSIRSFLKRAPDATTRGTWRDHFRDQHEIALTFWQFSLPRSLASVFEILLQWLDVLLVGAIAGVSSAAIYAIVSRYIFLGAFPAGAVAFAIAPQASSLLHLNRNSEAVSLYRASTYWIMILGYPIMLSLAVHASLLLSLFGSRYQMGATALAIIASAMLISLGAGTNTIVLLMAGGSAANLTISAVSVGLNVLANLLLIPRFGLTGAAVAWAIAILSTNVLTSVILWVRFRMHPFGREFAYVAVSALACYGILGTIGRVLFGSGALSATLFLFAGTLIYIVLVFTARDTLKLHSFRNLIRSRTRAPS